MSKPVGVNYPEIPDSRYVAQPVIDFLFLWEEEMGSAENPMAVDEDEVFSETMTPTSAKEPEQSRTALRSIENFQNSRQLFD